MNMIGVKSGVDWSRAPSGATHYKKGYFYRYNNGRWEHQNSEGWRKTINHCHWFKDAISKEEDLEMNKQEVKQVKGIDDLETGMFVFMKEGYSAYVNSDGGGNLGFLFTHGNEKVNYTMINSYRGLEYTPNKIYSITHWGYSLNSERYPVVTQSSEVDLKIKELEDTIQKAQQQLKELKGLNK